MTSAQGSLPGRAWLRWLSAGFAVAGLLDSLYLAWLKIAEATAACSGIGDCEAVNNSRYAEIGEVPIALIGAGAYLLILGLIFAEGKTPQPADRFRLAVFGLTLTGTLYSSFLTYLELAVLKVICPFCVFSAAMMLLSFFSSAVRLGEIDLEL